ncbi:AAA-domain-containing protein [Thozetella sp. PMI_491]|nr:AAA-domain-containing protein [Thozetella sp. PMI_491]
MPSKRKRDILEGFDPNQSDSADTDFDPTEVEPRGRPKKKTRGGGKKSNKSRKRSGYYGSDIEDDEGDEVSDSGEEGSFNDGFDEDDEEEDAPITAAGRRGRKTAQQPVSYKESSGSDSDDPDGSGDEARAPKTRIVTLKDPRAAANRGRKTSGASAGAPTRRSTRARTEELEEPLYELSTSGRHSRITQMAKSKSPEPVTRSGRATRAAKGLKQPPVSIPEAEQESEPNEIVEEAPLEAEAQDAEPVDGADKDEAIANEDAAMNEVADEQGDAPVQHPSIEEEDEEDEDDVPVRRSARTRNSISGPAMDDDADEEGHRGSKRRLTRKTSAKKSSREGSSEFDPESADNMSGSDAAPKAGRRRKSSQSESPVPTRGRRKGKGSRKEDSDEEIELDQDEMVEELEELRASSRSRVRRRRERSPSIIFEDLPKKRRTKLVDYSIKPLDPAAFEQEEEEDPAPATATPARGRKGGKNGSSQMWERNLNTTYGPFGGGGGAGSLLAGPWGTGATGGVDSDSSDDEMVQRSGVGGTVGMTPTSAAPPMGLFALPGPAKDLESAIAGATPNVGKIKNQKALADADPLGVDMSVDFSKVGGLDGHIDQLKEMVQLPLLYPELFQKFKVTPPRGVLFHGPPGTGKTLLARALANSIGSGGRKITFYMRKGADALSKWVGEAEKQLRLLFEEARKNQPSIIFFDEIDGLAPVRSSKQEQIHASIVSTLLALMDGMDGRGQVIVIGATNRPDNIDPALRRPGRFDREFLFKLPDKEARRSIISIHTKDWGLSDAFKDVLAGMTKGYGGADLRAMCTESALNAIQRTYPQVYTSKERLVVDPDKIDIHPTDFMISIKKMVPSSERATTSAAMPLPKSIEPLLRSQFKATVKALGDIFPRKKPLTALEEAMYEPYHDSDFGLSREAMNQEFERARIFRPRLLLTGLQGMGQGYLSAAILHHLEGVYIQNFDLATLNGDDRSVERVMVSLFAEVKRYKPSVIYIPNIESWWLNMTDAAIVTFATMLRAIPPTDPILLLATAESEIQDLDAGMLRDFFGYSKKNRAVIGRPNRENRFEYFSNIIINLKKSPTEFPNPENRKKRVLEDLPVAPAPPPKDTQLTKAEIKAQRKADLHALNLLKVRLQPIMDQINRKYRKFRQPVIPLTSISYLFAEADPNYVRPDIAEGEFRPYEIAQDKDGCGGIRDTATGKFFYNLETTTIEERLANGYYARPSDFYQDIERLVTDARNIGDHEREHKAKELRTNVYVDVHDIETVLTTQGIRFEEIYQRQLKRAKEAAERAKKRAALQSVVDLVQSDVRGDEDIDSQGPVGVDPPDHLGPHGPHTTAARFQVMSPLPGGQAGVAGAPGPSNGDTSPSQPAANEIQMGGMDDETQPMSGTSDMGPPSWPLRTGPATLGDSTRATAGTTQLSQTSALTQLPAGMSPSALINDASTTKTSDPSTNRGSSNFSTQRTNGFHNPEELPDTQPMSGHSAQGGQSDATSSDAQWPHSQAAALKQGLIHYSSAGSGQTSPTSSQAPQRTGGNAAASLGNILNDEPSNPSSLRNSGSSSSSSQQQAVIHEGPIYAFHQTLADRTSGCTIEQLEQINRELMEELWRTRGEWNRMTVLGTLTTVFNDTIRDIEDLQGFQHSSQEQASQDRIDAPCVHLT